MSELSAKKRAELPVKDFGLPEKARTKAAKKESGNYPMPDKKHADRQIARRPTGARRQPDEERARANRPESRSRSRGLTSSRAARWPARIAAREGVRLRT